MDQISIYTHTSQTTTIKSNRIYLVAQEITDENNFNMSSILTRSISSGALNQIRARSGSIVSQTSRISGSGGAVIRQELRRTLSSRSLTLPSPVIRSEGLSPGDHLYDSSLNQFIEYIEGKSPTIAPEKEQEGEEVDAHNEMVLLWESLPQTTKDIFISRALVKRTGHTNQELNYEDVKELFGSPSSSSAPSKSGFIQYRKRIGPYLRREKKLDEPTISKIVGEMYRKELSAKDKQLLKREAMASHEKFVSDRLIQVDRYLNVNLNNKSVKKDPALQEIVNVTKKPGRRNRAISFINELTQQSKKLLNKISSSTGKHNHHNTTRIQTDQTFYAL